MLTVVLMSIKGGLQRSKGVVDSLLTPSKTLNLREILREILRKILRKVLSTVLREVLRKVLREV